MTCSLRMLLILAVLCPAGAGLAAPAEKAAAQSASKPVSPVTVNVNVNVRVSHDTKVDVKIEAPFMPVIGTVQLPDFVQHLLSGFFKMPSPPAAKVPATPDSTVKPSPGPAKK